MQRFGQAPPPVPSPPAQRAVDQTAKPRPCRATGVRRAVKERAAAGQGRRQRPGKWSPRGDRRSCRGEARGAEGRRAGAQSGSGKARHAASGTTKEGCRRPRCQPQRREAALTADPGLGIRGSRFGTPAVRVRGSGFGEGFEVQERKRGAARRATSTRGARAEALAFDASYWIGEPDGGPPVSGMVVDSVPESW